MATKQAQRLKEQVVKALERDEPETPRQAILDEASELTHQSRNTAYGNPEDNFRNIANLWTAYARSNPKLVDLFYTPADVAIMMILMKTARLATNPNHHDSCVDIAGYAACLGDMQASSSVATTHAQDIKTAVDLAERALQTNETNERTLRRRS